MQKKATSKRKKSCPLKAIIWFDGETFERHPLDSKGVLVEGFTKAPYPKRREKYPKPPNPKNSNISRIDISNARPQTQLLTEIQPLTQTQLLTETQPEQMNQVDLDDQFFGIPSIEEDIDFCYDNGYLYDFDQSSPDFSGPLYTEDEIAFC